MGGYKHSARSAVPFLPTQIFFSCSKCQADAVASLLRFCIQGEVSTSFHLLPLGRVRALSPMTVSAPFSHQYQRHSGPARCLAPGSHMSTRQLAQLPPQTEPRAALSAWGLRAGLETQPWLCILPPRRTSHVACGVFPESSPRTVSSVGNGNTMAHTSNLARFDKIISPKHKPVAWCLPGTQKVHEKRSLFLLGI